MFVVYWHSHVQSIMAGAGAAATANINKASTITRSTSSTPRCSVDREHDYKGNNNKRARGTENCPRELATAPLSG